MSVAQPNPNSNSGGNSSFLLEEPYTPVQLGLRQLFGRNEAEIIQNVNLWLNQPWEDYSLDMSMRAVMDDGRFWVRIPPRMLFDRFTGRARDLSESTFKRALKSCIEQGIMIVRDDLSTSDEKNVRWITLVREVLDPQLEIYQDVWKRVIRERLEERQFNRMLPAKREDELWEEMQSRLKECEKVLRAAGLFSLHERYEPAGGQIDLPTYKASNSDLRKSRTGVKLTQVPAQIEPAAGSKRPKPEVKMNPETQKPPYIKVKGKGTFKTKVANPPAEATPAAQDIVVENQDFLSEEIETQTSTEEAKQFALPHIAGVSLPFKASQSAIDLARRVQGWGRAEGIDIDEATAAHIVLRNVWGDRLVHMGEAKIKKLIGPDWKEAGLSSAIGGQAKEELLQDIDRLRWLLWIWPLQRGKVEDYYERRGKPADLSGTFIRQAREDQLPDAAWLEGQCEAIAAEAREKEQAARQEAANAVWDGLGPHHQRQVLTEAERRANGAGNYNQQVRRRDEQRIALLLDAEFVDSLPEEIVETKGVADSPFDETKSEPYVPTPGERDRMGLHATKLAGRVRSGELDLDGAEDEAIGFYNWGPKPAALVREMVEKIVESLECKAA